MPPCLDVTEGQLVVVTDDKPLGRKGRIVSFPNVWIAEVLVTDVAETPMAAHNILRPLEIRDQRQAAPGIGVLETGHQPVVTAPSDGRPGPENSPAGEGPALL